MSIKVKDADLNDVYFVTSGTGTSGDPFRMDTDVNIQDQSSPIIVANLSNETASTTLATLLAIDDYTFDVADATGFLVGSYLSIFSIPDNRFYLATILNIATNTITVDTPLDFAFPIGSFVTSGNRNLNVDGSVTPVIYGLRNTDQAIGSTFDITRLMFTCTTSGTNDLSRFGDIVGGLTRGIMLRKKNGTYENIFNVKTNGELANLMYDLTIYTAGGQGQNRRAAKVRIRQS